MVADLDTTIPQRWYTEQVLTDLDRVRRRTLALVAHLRPAELEATHSPIMSPLVWDLAHIAAYEDLWLVHRLAQKPLLHPELAAVYDAFETPRAVRGEIELLDVPLALRYMAEVRERTARALRDDGASRRNGNGNGSGNGSGNGNGNGNGNGVSDGFSAWFIAEMVLRHELQHTETMLQTMAIADLLPPRDVIDPAAPEAQARRRGAESWIEIEGGSCSIGAGEDRFAYDNERPSHQVRLDRFRIARAPVSNREWREFCDEDGYDRVEHWSAEGWAWRRGAEPLRHPAAGAGADDLPACHLCFHEAEAFASWRGARLPSEAEWERAAVSANGALSGRRRVWEWTSSELVGYPGFVAYPYREYSEAFFGKGYRVLRGGSWATDARVASSTFRNWDLPIRRQIFAGIRLAMDA